MPPISPPTTGSETGLALRSRVVKLGFHSAPRRQHMLTNPPPSAYADMYGNDRSDRRGRRQQGPRCRLAGRRRPSGAGREPGTAPGPERARPRLVLAGHRQPPRRHQADRPPQVRPADREAMMFERFTDSARHIVVQAQHDARRLGHHYIGCEHLLLAAAEAGEPASAVLRDQGVTPERVEAEILRTIGPGAVAGPADPLRGLDREALAAIGIDLDVVRARIEAAFGPDALDRAVLAHKRAAQACRRNRRPAWEKGPVAELMRRRRRRRAGHGALPGPAPLALNRPVPGPSPRG